MDHQPFRITGPALISFSGGRTSGYMLWRILQAHEGTLPADVVVTFANTGKEMPQTLDFVRDCSTHWNVPIIWLEYAHHDEPKHRWRITTYEAASRLGEPFEALIKHKKYLPNPTMRFCTIELKIRAMAHYARSLGWKDWTVVLGLRADEPRRVASSRRRADTGSDPWDNAMPLATAGVVVKDVLAFWDSQNWGLNLPQHNGKTFLGNCDGCFMKSRANVFSILKANPEIGEWWAAQEASIPREQDKGCRFRWDRPSYQSLIDMARDTSQARLPFGDDVDEMVDCFCGDGT